MKATKLPKSKAKTAYGLLSEVRRLILAEPLRYDQWTYIARPDGARGADKETQSGVFPSCGTVGCVAGWVATLTHGRKVFYSDAPDLAEEVLGLTGDQACELFDSTATGATEPQTKAHASAGAAHIARFQKAHAAQLKAKRI